MRIACIGGGPAGLFFALVMRKHFPAVVVDVYERGQPGEVSGQGVALSREATQALSSADPELAAALEPHLVPWTELEVTVGEGTVVCAGQPGSGVSRLELRRALQRRCEALGVRLHFGVTVLPTALPEADLVVAADGADSALRAHLAAELRPRAETGRSRYAWWATSRPVSAHAITFASSSHGLFHAHAFPFARGARTSPGPVSTFAVECREETWRAAGLDAAGEPESVAFLEGLFSRTLSGHRLVPDGHGWRPFTTVTCERWSHGRVVLLGDAAHTAHWSSGSGTGLAVEDALGLEAAFRQHGLHVARVLEDYEHRRRPEAQSAQRAARASQAWFERAGGVVGQPPVQFAVNLVTRTGHVTWDGLRQRDPRLAHEADALFAATHGARGNSDGTAPPPLFAPLRLRAMTLPNRVVLSPMCQYTAEEGVPGDWHLVHLGSRAVGGAGLVLAEATAVTPAGRITPGCAGLWNDAQADAWRRVVDFVHHHSGARIGVQLAHAGRKASTHRPWEGTGPLGMGRGGAWPTLGPSALPFKPGWPAPRAMTSHDLVTVKEAFVEAARRAHAAGFDFVELHAAHGYLLSSFLCPLTNQRDDEYGGTLEGRMRFPLEVFAAVRDAWPAEKPLGVRVSASDWLEPEGQTVEDTVAFARRLEALGCDVVDVSSGGNVPESRPGVGRLYQVAFAEAVKAATGMAVMAVGGIFGADLANTVLVAGRADLVAIGREFLSDPYLVHRHAQVERVDGLAWPGQYVAVKPRR